MGEIENITGESPYEVDLCMTSEIQPVTIETMPHRHIVGVAAEFTMATRGEIPQLWNAFFAADHKIAKAVPGAMYGVSFNADGEGNFSYGVGIEVQEKPDETPAGTCRMWLSEGKYAVRRVFGPVTELPGQLDALFSDWLPSSGYALREGAVFERYPEDARNGPEGMAYELWVPVEARP